MILACFLSLTLLPAIMSFCSIQPSKSGNHSWALRVISTKVSLWRRVIVLFFIPLILFSSYSISRGEINDNVVHYVQDSHAFIEHLEVIEKNLTGSIDINMELMPRGGGDVSEIHFLTNVDQFVEWLRTQPEVRYVSSYTDVMKHLNRVMHGGFDEWYKIPASNELAAQYLLFYDMSLPKGLDLTHQINIDKSATKVSIIVNDMDTKSTLGFMGRVEGWLERNGSYIEYSSGIGSIIITMLLALSTFHAMLNGAAVALFVIAVVLLFSFRALLPGFLSVMLVVVSIVLTYGIWNLIAHRYDMTAIVALCMVTGILVDNAVHFINKYVYASEELGKSSKEAVSFAFHTVGGALTTNAVVLSLGFGTLCFSLFKSNATMGALTVISILIALLVTFTLLTSLLLLASDVSHKLARIRCGARRGT